jgi:predicted esterase
MIPMQHHRFRVERTAHYYTIGEPGPHIRQFWLVCHGYGQLANEFLQDFEQLNNEHTLVVAPEGMNHFYRKGFSGPVGANWMTRHFREDEIRDYAKYLQDLYTHYLAQLPKDVRVVLLGFSQGTATVCRWMLAMQPHFHDLLLWAGLPPEDLDYQKFHNYLADKNLYLLYGSSDPFLTPDHLTQLHEMEEKNGVDFGELPFEGGHEIPSEALHAFLQKFN